MNSSDLLQESQQGSVCTLLVELQHGVEEQLNDEQLRLLKEFTAGILK